MSVTVGAPTVVTVGAPTLVTVGAPTLATVGAPTLATVGAPTLATVGAPTLRERIGRGKKSSQLTRVPKDKREANGEATKESRRSYGGDWMRRRYSAVMLASGEVLRSALANRALPEGRCANSAGCGITRGCACTAFSVERTRISAHNESTRPSTMRRSTSRTARPNRPAPLSAMSNTQATPPY